MIGRASAGRGYPSLIGRLTAVAEVSQRYFFKRRSRLLQKDGFGAVLSRKSSIHSEHFQLNYRPGQSEGPRFGVVVAKKLVRFAVRRNRVKRLAREAFRLARPNLPRFDLVLRLRRAPASEAWEGLSREIEMLLRRLGSIKQDAP